MSFARSPLAPLSFPALPALPQVDIAVAQTGIRYKNRPDFLCVHMPAQTQVAGVLTTSATRSAAIDACRSALQQGAGEARVLLVNAGNANAFTGSVGVQTVDTLINSAAAHYSVLPQHIYTASTGVIGESLPTAPLLQALHTHAPQPSDASLWQQAADAIATTDTFSKGATTQAVIDGVTVTLVGIAKGSGMIAPDMATLLSFVWTDAAIDAATLQHFLHQATDSTYNAITVDGDTSTSDTLLAFATQTAAHAPITDVKTPQAQAFYVALHALLHDLALQVVRDGEGAQKLIEVQVSGALSVVSARKIARTIADSPLVKTAVAGEDANWGRIVAAIGRAGEPANRDALQIFIGGVLVAADGKRVNDYDETPVAAHMKGTHVVLHANVGAGDSSATVYTCDLTHGYITINGSYRS